MAKFHGVVASELRKLFPVHAVPPPLARKLVGSLVHGHAARADVLAKAQAVHANFPLLHTADGRVDEKTHYLSDAWACGLYATRLAGVEARPHSFACHTQTRQ